MAHPHETPAAIQDADPPGYARLIAYSRHELVTITRWVQSDEQLTPTDPEVHLRFAYSVDDLPASRLDEVYEALGEAIAAGRRAGFLPPALPIEERGWTYPREKGWTYAGRGPSEVTRPSAS